MSSDIEFERSLLRADIRAGNTEAAAAQLERVKQADRYPIRMDELEKLVQENSDLKNMYREAVNCWREAESQPS